MLYLGLIVILTLVVWYAVTIRHGGLLAGCLIVLLTGSCFGHPFLHVSAITSDRVLLVVLVGLYVLYRRYGWTTPKPMTLADSCFGLFLGVLVLSTFAHDWRYDGAQPASRLLFLYLMPAAVYWVARQTQISTRELKWVYGYFIVFALYLSVTAIAEVKEVWSVVFPGYIGSDTYHEFLGRARGPFLNPVANGFYLTAGIACLMVGWMRVDRTRRVPLLVAATLIAIGAAATMTRCVWMGLAICVMFVLLVSIPRHRRLGTAVLACCLGLTLVSVGWKSLSAFKRDKNVSVSEMSESAKLRPMLAAVAWNMFLDHPLTGVGLGQYKQSDGPYIAARSVDMPLERVRPYHQHNVILALLTETGLLGTVPFLATLLLWTQSAWRVWRRQELPRPCREMGLVFICTLISYLINGLFHDVALIPMTNLLLFFVAGVMMSVALGRATAAAPQRELSWGAPPQVWTPPQAPTRGLPVAGHRG